MKDGNHNLKISLAGFEYKPEIKSKNGYQLKVTDEQGNILHNSEFKSFTANFLKMLYSNMIGNSSGNAKNIINGDVDPDLYPLTTINFAGGAGFRMFGIGVGTGNSAVANDNYNLNWVAGLTYNNVVVGAPAVVGSTIKVDITRQISNTSGSSITVSESGLICGSEGDYSDNVLIARDLVSVTLANNKKSTWTYSIVVDFSSTSGGFVKNFLDLLIKPWTQATASAGFSTRRSHSSVVFDGKIWVIGGTDGTNIFNDVWSSSDGITWTRATASAGFSTRFAHSSVVFDGKIWVIGGYDGASRFNDVWSSSDGITWTRATASAGFSTRFAHSSVVFDGKIWVIGGTDGTNYFKDVWSSSDGITWTQATASAGFSTRRSHSSVVFDGKIWVIGGFDGTNYFKDVWAYCAKIKSTAIVADDALGIIVGTSDSAFSSTATSLITKITHGSASGKLEYGVFPDTAFTVEPSTAGSKTAMTLARSFTNSSGSTIVIKEVGIQSVNGLLCRIIPASPLEIINGETKVIAIQFETEV
jgi:dihydrofolate reductase